MSHPFGDLIRQHLSRKHGLSQNKLADGINQDPAVIAGMCKGSRLTGQQARQRVIDSIHWLWSERALLTRPEADALLAAAGMAGLRYDAADPTERRLFAELLPRRATTSRCLGYESSFVLSDLIRDFSCFIEEKTTGFVGRQFVFDAIARFTATHPRGYFFVRGYPGIGKSALAAQLVKLRGYVHHFNILSEGINRAETFLTNICAQLITTYNLDYTTLPPDATHDGGFLSRLLGEVSDKLAPTERAIIVVDALDEADQVSLAPGANVLCLPVTLPPKIYIIATTRKMPFSLRIECDQETLDLEQESEANLHDIRLYLERALQRTGIQSYIAAQAISAPTFVEHLVRKSQGNFMYLRHVLAEIDQGAFKDLRIDAIPAGLTNYYEDHWRRMRGRDEDAWFTYKLPVVMALTVRNEPVSLDEIAQLSGIKKLDRARIPHVLLHEWAQFLHASPSPYANGAHQRYRIYHTSFHNFILQREEVIDAHFMRDGISTREVNARTAE